MSIDAVIHGMFELFGVIQRWRFEPYHSLTDNLMERLKDFLVERKWL